jgi:hypothetical protein
MTPDHPAPPAHCDDNDDDIDNDVHEREQEEEDKGPLAVAMASATRSLLHGLRNTTVPLRNLIKDAMKKNAFLAIGRRTATARPASSSSLALPSATMITKQPTTSYWERAVGTYVVACCMLLETDATFVPFQRLNNYCRASSCGPGLVKGSLLSFVVFGVYDILVLRQTSSRANKKAGGVENKSPTNDVTTASSSATNNNHEGRSAALPSEESKLLLLPSTNSCPTITTTASKPFPSLHSWVVPHGHTTTPLYLHFGSGALSGFMFSLVLDAWDVAVHVAKGHAIPHRLNAPLLVRRAMHHSVGYAMLFGSFETLRRRLDEWSTGFFFVAGGDDDHHHQGQAMANVLDALAGLGLVRHDDVAQSYDVSAIPLANAFLAGGVAGQLHHVADHCTRHWRRSAATAAAATAATRTTFTIYSWWPKRPPDFKATMASFLPTAVCFVLFQYGADIVDRLLCEEDGRVVWYPH